MFIKTSTLVAACALVQSSFALTSQFFQCTPLPGGAPMFNNPNGPTLPSTRGLNTYAKNAVGVDDFSWGVAMAASAGSSSSDGAAGKATFPDVMITRAADAFTPAVFLATAKGQTLDSCALVLMKSTQGGQQLASWYIFKQVAFTSVQHASGDESPVETLTISYGQVEIGNQPYGADGRPSSSPPNSAWNVVGNKQA